MEATGQIFTLKHQGSGRLKDLISLEAVSLQLPGNNWISPRVQPVQDHAPSTFKLSQNGSLNLAGYICPMQNGASQNYLGIFRLFETGRSPYRVLFLCQARNAFSFCSESWCAGSAAHFCYAYTNRSPRSSTINTHNKQ